MTLIESFTKLKTLTFNSMSNDNSTIARISEENSLEEFDGFLPTSAVLALSWVLVFIAIILSITSCIIYCCACCHTEERTHEPATTSTIIPSFVNTTTTPGERRTRTALRAKYAWLTTSTLVLVLASFMAGGYGVARRVLETQDYKGLMRITGWSYSSVLTTDKRDDETNERYTEYHVEAILFLEWGYSWACPNHGNKICSGDEEDLSSSVRKCRKLICKKSGGACSDEEMARAKRDVSFCASQYFDPILASNGYYTPYNVYEGPSMDENWPSLVAYGDCSNCVVASSAPRPKALKSVRVVVILFLLFSFGLVAAAVIVWCRDDAVTIQTNRPQNLFPVVPEMYPTDNVLYSDPNTTTTTPTTSRPSYEFVHAPQVTATQTSPYNASVPVVVPASYTGEDSIPTVSAAPVVVYGKPVK